MSLVLLIHGGAWIAGDKSANTGAAQYCASDLGLAGATLNYRYLSEDVNMEDLVDDIDAALATVKAKAAEKGVNLNKVLLTGSSAGGHLSMLYAYSRKATAPITPVAVVSNSGPTDLCDENFHVNNALGDLHQLFSHAAGIPVTAENRNSAVVKAALAKISPLYYVNSDTVPTIINHGAKDSIVPYSNAVSLDKALTAFGVTHIFNTYPNSDHDLGDDKDVAKIADKNLFEYVDAYLR